MKWFHNVGVYFFEGRSDFMLSISYTYQTLFYLSLNNVQKLINTDFLTKFKSKLILI